MKFSDIAPTKVPVVTGRGFVNLNLNVSLFVFISTTYFVTIVIADPL